MTSTDQQEIVEERVTFPNGKLTLSGILAYPESAEPAWATLLCPPHPHFAGDMNNNVLRALARRLASQAITLRFDYRGVGESSIDLPPGASVFDYWHDIEETKDYRDALDDVQAAASELRRVAPGLPLTVIGYSFGAVTAMRHGCADESVGLTVGISPPLTRVGLDFLAGCQKPCLVLCGKNDFLYSPEEISRLKRVVGPAVAIELLEGQDHFFRGEEG
ncbi:MAG: alpha/beta fold hydrolase, partial [Planctomycetes bacterium]|nr:alpha/beta fold hydrolase [Planctomycetota bacterium]